MARDADDNGVLDLEGALQLFSYAFELLPGVTLPPGATNDRASWVGLAGSEIAAHLGDLTPAQRQIVLSYFRDVSGVPTAVTAATTAVPNAPRIFLANTTPQPATYVRQEIATLMAQAFQREGALLGHAISDAPADASLSHVWLFLAEKSLTIPPSQGGGVAAGWTLGSSGQGFDSAGNILDSFTGQGKITDCAIFLAPTVWGSSSSGHWIASEDDVDTVYHEVFHCYQEFVLGSISGTVVDEAPDWVIEGGATWAAASILPHNEAYNWKEYTTTPRTPLAKRSYDGFGFLFEIEYEGRPLWPAWWQAWTDASHGGWDTTHWFDELTFGVRKPLINSWASSFYLDKSLGQPWTTAGTGQVPAPGTAPQLFNGDQLQISTLPYATYQVLIDPPNKSTTLVVSVTNEPNTRVEDLQKHGVVGVGLVALCWAAQCKPCPQSNANTSPLPKPLHVTGAVSWAYDAIAKWGTATIVAISQPDYCKLKQQNPPQPCMHACAGSNGDPHMTSVNLRRYNFQDAGEYELLRSSDGSVEFQGRQQPVPGGKVTINTAVAMKVGTHRVGVYVVSGAQPLEVHVDGAPVTLTSAMAVGGGKLVPHNGNVEIDMPDGIIAWAVATKPEYGIILRILPTDALRQSGVGVLGVVPLSYALPPLPDGTGARISADQVAAYNYKYKTFGPAWRVTDATTLFDYTPGKSTASYTVPGFVPEGGPPQDLPYGGTSGFDPQAWAAAETTCAGVNDVTTRDDCVYDVSVTGDSGYLQEYEAMEALLAALNNGSSGGTSSASGAPTIKPLVMNFNGVGGYVIGPDGALDITYNSPTGAQIIAVDPATTTIRTQASLNTDAPGGLAAASGALWTMVNTSNAQCAVEQIDPASLQVIAQLKPPSCPQSWTIAGAGDELWIVGGDKVLDRIDTTQRKVTATIQVPDTTLGMLRASATSVFWSDQTAIYRIDPQSSSLVKIDNADEGVFVDDGIWTQVDAGTVGFINTYGGTPRTLNAGRDLIGADEASVYIENPGTKAITQYPIDGSQGRVLGTSNTSGGGSLGDLIVGPQNAYRVYGAAEPQGGPFALYVENYPLP